MAAADAAVVGVTAVVVVVVAVVGVVIVVLARALGARGMGSEEGECMTSDVASSDDEVEDDVDEPCVPDDLSIWIGGEPRLTVRSACEVASELRLFCCCCRRAFR